MNLQVTIALNAEALSAVQDLAAAIRPVGGAAQSAAPAAKALATAAAEIKEEADDDGTFFWADESTGFFGEVPTLAAYNKLKKKDPGVYRIPANVHAEKVEALRLKNETEAADKKAAAAASKKPAADKKPAAKSDDDAPSIDDLIAVFSAYLPKDLDAAERKVRHAFVKPMLERFGAAKASEIADEHRALAINLVQRKMAGEDIDPTDAEFEAIDADEDGLV
jgi:hypothetical protein